MASAEVTVATIAHNYLERFKARYGSSITLPQWSALNAILGCRTAQYGRIQLSCTDCATATVRYQSCGHRSCSQCQQHCSAQWLQRQRRKLLPVRYFLVTFTLPAELRGVAKAHQQRVYAWLFEAALSTLCRFGLNDRHLAGELAMTAVLHTHTRRLDYHPHVHCVVPGGVVDRQRARWRHVRGRYLFNSRALAQVFKGTLLKTMARAGLASVVTPTQWVVHCQCVGAGLPALHYLSRYLYRGVINDRQLVSDDGTFVTFRYKDSQTQSTKTRQLRGEDFIHLILQHTLPKGFRRVRDYGFLHGNAKRLLATVQWCLQVAVPPITPIARPPFRCGRCQAPMAIVGFTPPKPPD